LSAAEVRKQLILQKGYSDKELPCEETIRTKVNKLGYYPTMVQKSKPIKKIPETDAIFVQIHKVNKEADENEKALRISMDAKAGIPLGFFSRNGKSRIKVKALDHDFKPDERVIPFGIFLPQSDELYVYLTTSNFTSDFIADCLCDFWTNVKSRFSQVETLVINQDNGPQNNSRRTQFMKRITNFVDQFQISINLAYYPPYHSKHNPIERVWGVLENHWNGSLLDTIKTVFNFLRTMTWNGVHPIPSVVRKTYAKGVKLTKQAMNQLETRIQRLTGLEKYFVSIKPLNT